MSNELQYYANPASDSGLTIVARVYNNAGVQTGADIACIEVGTLAIYRGNMPTAVAGNYAVRFFNSVNELQAQGCIEWDGTKEVVLLDVLTDTNELQQNQNNWLTATGFSTFNASTDEVTVVTNNDKSGYSLANNSITSSTVANNAFNNNTFTTGFYSQIGSEVDSSLLSYDGPTKAELDTAISGLATQASVNNIPQAVDAELTANHGSGSWVEATGFATPSDISSGFDEIKGVGWTDETLKDIRDNLGTGGTTPQQVYDYFVAGSRENVFKTDISGVATTVQLNAARDSVISEVNNNETKIDNLQSSVTNLENISVSDIRTELATELSRLDVDVSSVAYNDTALTALVNALPTLTQMEASAALTAVADITGLSTHSAADVVTAMQSVADQFKADVSGLSTFNASTDEVTTDNASRVASRATGFATPSDVSSALVTYDAPTKAEMDAAVNSVLSAISDLPDSGSISGLLQKLELLEKYHDNTTAYLDATGTVEVEQKDAYFTVVYDNDGTTELKRIAFQNSAGASALITEATRYVKL